MHVIFTRLFFMRAGLSGNRLVISSDVLCRILQMPCLDVSWHALMPNFVLLLQILQSFDSIQSLVGFNDSHREEVAWLFAGVLLNVVAMANVCDVDLGVATVLRLQVCWPTQAHKPIGHANLLVSVLASLIHAHLRSDLRTCIVTTMRRKSGSQHAKTPCRIPSNQLVLINSNSARQMTPPTRLPQESCGMATPQALVQPMARAMASAATACAAQTATRRTCRNRCSPPKPLCWLGSSPHHQ